MHLELRRLPAAEATSSVGNLQTSRHTLQALLSLGLESAPLAALAF